MQKMIRYVFWFGTTELGITRCVIPEYTNPRQVPACEWDPDIQQFSGYVCLRLGARLSDDTVRYAFHRGRGP